MLSLPNSGNHILLISGPHSVLWLFAPSPHPYCLNSGPILSPTWMPATAPRRTPAAPHHRGSLKCKIITWHHSPAWPPLPMIPVAQRGKSWFYPGAHPLIQESHRQLPQRGWIFQPRWFILGLKCMSLPYLPSWHQLIFQSPAQMPAPAWTVFCPWVQFDSQLQAELLSSLGLRFPAHLPHPLWHSPSQPPSTSVSSCHPSTCDSKGYTMWSWVPADWVSLYKLLTGPKPVSHYWRGSFSNSIKPIPSFIPNFNNYNVDCNNVRLRHVFERAFFFFFWSCSLQKLSIQLGMEPGPWTVRAQNHQGIPTESFLKTLKERGGRHGKHLAKEGNILTLAKGARSHRKQLSTISPPQQQKDTGSRHHG